MKFKSLLTEASNEVYVVINLQNGIDELFRDGGTFLAEYAEVYSSPENALKRMIQIFNSGVHNHPHAPRLKFGRLGDPDDEDTAQGTTRMINTIAQFFEIYEEHFMDDQIIAFSKRPVR